MCYNADNAMSHSPFLLLNGATQYYLQMFHFICSAIILFKIKDTSKKIYVRLQYYTIRKGFI